MPEGEVRLPFAEIVQRVFFISIFLLPLLTQAIMIYYDGFVIDIVENGWQYFWDDLVAECSRHPTLQIVWLITMIGSTCTMVSSVIEFFRTTKDLRTEYSLVDAAWRSPTT
jgi:hypothetical protein